MGGSSMADVAAFDWNALASFKAEGRFLDHYPDDQRNFWAPRDNVHGLLLAAIGSVQHSIVLNMYGYDDPELDALIRQHMTTDHVYVQMSLDKTQAGGRAEKALLAEWPSDAFGTSVAVGQSMKHAISHLKVCIIDGVYTLKGSTNWSLKGEGAQDNELSLSRNAVIAAEARAVLDLNHTEMLKQMSKASVSG